jgi:hypothetical protein
MGAPLLAHFYICSYNLKPIICFKALHTLFSSAILQKFNFIELSYLLEKLVPIHHEKWVKSQVLLNL